MIKTTDVTINEINYKYTVSTLGYYIQRNDGKKFVEAYDETDSTYTYTELTDSPKPINVQNITFDVLYPIGSIYIGTMSVCPLQVMGIGQWELVAKDRVLQGAGTRGDVGTEVAESLPNVTGDIGYALPSDNTSFQPSGAFYRKQISKPVVRWYDGVTSGEVVALDNNKSASTYQDDAPVQQDAYLVNIWERIS